jgi:hypothetical protein
MARPYRREVPGACGGIGIVGLAECLESGDGGAGEGCSDGGRWGIAFGDRPAYGRNEGSRMTGAPGTISFGEELTVRLRNTTDEPLRTGTSEQHTIQSRRDDGRRSVLAEPDGFDGAAVDHPPGEGFRWGLTIDPDGYGGPWEVCGP